MKLHSSSDSLSSLHALADKYQSDKGFGALGGHGYTRIYESLFAPRRTAPLHILEIGLLHPTTQLAAKKDGSGFSRCPSLDMWADFLPQAQIVGLDIEDFSGYKRDRVTVLRADQGSRESLRQAIQPHLGEGFDVIIDDGSHASPHQQVTLGVLWPMVKPGGVYIIEDLHWQPPQLERADVAKTQKLMRVLQLGGALDGLPTALTDAERQTLQREVREVALFDSLKQTDDPSEFQDAIALLAKRI